MTQKNITAKDLGKKTGISYRTIESWLSVRNTLPRADIAVMIAKAVGVSVEYLITGEKIGEDLLSVKIQSNPKIKLLAETITKLPENRIDDLIVMTKPWIEAEEVIKESAG